MLRAGGSVDDEAFARVAWLSRGGGEFMNRAMETGPKLVHTKP